MKYVYSSTWPIKACDQQFKRNSNSERSITQHWPPNKAFRWIAPLGMNINDGYSLIKQQTFDAYICIKKHSYSLKLSLQTNMTGPVLAGLYESNGWGLNKLKLRIHNHPHRNLATGILTQNHGGFGGFLVSWTARSFCMYHYFRHECHGGDN